MELAYIDDFIYQFFLLIHLLVLMLALVYVSGRLWSYFLNVLFEVNISPIKKKISAKQKRFYDDF